MDKDKKEPAKEELKSKVVETYAEDMAKVIENDTEGLVKKIIHEEEEHQKEKTNLSPQSQKNRLFMFISFLLLAVALVILAFFLLKKDANTVPVEQQFTPLIFNDKSVFVEVAGFTRDQIVQTVLNQINQTEVKIGGVEGIYLTENKKIVGFSKFINLIKGNLVFDKADFFNDNFLLGSVLVGLKASSPTAGDFFLLLKVSSTMDVFNAMRTWENKMFSDLRGFLGINISSETNYLFTKNFEDGIIDNKNARVLYDKDGGLVLAYVFADDNSLIITSSQNAVHEIILRLASGKRAQ